MMKVKGLLVLLLLLCFLPVIAQNATPEVTPEATPQATLEATTEATPEVPADEGCPMLVQRALDLTNANCEQIGRDMVCYGHSDLEAESRADTSAFKFEEPGDIADVINLQSLNLSPMDTAQSIWGVILMRVRANLAATEQKNVTFVVFGDVALTNEAQVIPVTLTQTANVRNRPTLEGSVLASIEEGTVLTANGRSEDEEWLRVLLPQDEESTNPVPQTGWVSVTVIEPVEDLETLTTASANEDTTPYGPMQAFYFESGQDDAPCSQAPNSGLMIQTPEGAASVTLWIDEVIIELDGTTFVQAQPNGDLTVNTLEGSATVTAFGESRTAIAGTQVSVELNATLGAIAAPQDPVPYDADDVQSLPTTLLETPITVPEPLALGEGVPAPGSWSFRWGVEELSCPDGTKFTFQSSGNLIGVTVGQSGETVSYGGLTYTRESTGVYTGSYIDDEGNLHQERLTVNALDSISGETQIEFATVVCTLNVPFSLRLVSG